MLIGYSFNWNKLGSKEMSHFLGSFQNSPGNVCVELNDSLIDFSDT